jgi:hypothetical protein
MLEKIRDTPFENLIIEDEHRTPGTPQQDVVAAYLLRLRTPEMSAGFTALLTHVLAMHEHCGDPEPNYLKLLATTHPSQVGIERERLRARAEVRAAREHLRSLASDGTAADKEART